MRFISLHLSNLESSINRTTLVFAQHINHHYRLVAKLFQNEQNVHSHQMQLCGDFNTFGVLWHRGRSYSTSGYTNNIYQEDKFILVLFDS